LFVVTEDWYFVSHRLPLARAAMQAGFNVSVATRVSRHAEVIESAGVRLFPVDFNRGGVRPSNELRTLLRLLRLFRSERPDIVHNVAMKPVIYGSLAAWVAGVGSVVNALGGLGYLFCSAEKRALLLRLLAWPFLKIALGRKASCLIVQNSENRDRMVTLGLVAPERVRLIPGAGVDLHQFSEERTITDPPLVILPARLIADKGVREFVSAAQILRSETTHARFALVGQPDPMNPTSIGQAEIDEWTQKGIVEWFGWCDDMPSVLAQTQIVCLPSYNEGMPKALLEAAASGCAIVTTDIPGCRDIVQDGETGLLVPPRDAAALVSALRTLIRRPELRARLGEAARRRAEADFSVEKVNAAIFNVYSELLR
jgi:glycosyltransferase involved in cell wall biosynthesis